MILKAFFIMPPNMIISCYFLGSSYFNTGVYDKAMKYLQEGIRIGEHAPYPFFQMMCYNLVGMVSGTLGDDIMSVEYMLKSYYIALDHQELGYLYIICLLYTSPSPRD